MKNYVCITAGEWRNICSMGRIRLQEMRAVSAVEQFSPENYDALFSLAADRFLLGETSDFLIAEYSCLRSEIEGIQPPGFEDGIRWLLLRDVLRFFPIRADDAWAFEADAQKAHVRVGEASFESQWNQWFKAQVTNQACINGLTLMRAFGFGGSSDPHDKEPFVVRWETLARQVAVPDAEGLDTPDFTANFMNCRHRLFDLVREDADSGAFFVSCPIEWINLRSDMNIFDSDADLAELAHRLHEKYLNIAFEPSLSCAEDLKEYEALLLAKAPEAFPDAWRPAMISLYVRFNHRIRFGSSAPNDIVAAVRALDTLCDKRAAEMLAFLFGVALGSNKTHNLERALDPERFEMVGVSAAVLTPDQFPAATETGPIPVDQTVIPPPALRISRILEVDFRGIAGEFHVLTYAEDGFSPLDIHGRRFGVDREQIVAFAKAVNDVADVGSLHPLAPISAVPSELVRDRQDVDALAVSIGNFFRGNRETIKARRIVFDFRLPSVPAFVIEALNAAIQTDVDCGLDEILILEM